MTTTHDRHGLGWNRTTSSPVGAARTAPARRFWSSIDSTTTLGRQRIVGIVLFLALAGPFFVFSRFPKLDTIRDDIDSAVRAASDADGASCVGQGFCFGGSLLGRWWEFSITYLQVVTVGMVFAFLVAGLATTFLFPNADMGRFGRRGLRGSLQGLTVGPAMTLCSACIVPVAGSFRERGASVESTIAITQGSSTLNAPAILMTVAVFTPMLAASRIGLSVLGAVLIGPLVAYVVDRHRRPAPPAGDTLGVACSAAPLQSWGTVLRKGIPAWLRSSARFIRRLGPVMIVAGFVSGLVIQWLTPESVSRYLGDHVLAVALAATVGVLINVPLMFEIPLVMGLMALGMGTAPAAALLFAAAAGGPITFWGLAKHIPVRGVAAYAALIWLLGAGGGLAVLGLDAVLPG